MSAKDRVLLAEELAAVDMGQRYMVEFPKTEMKGLGLRFFKASKGSTGRNLVVKNVVPDRLASTLSPAIVPSSVVVEINGIAVSGREATFKAVLEMAKNLPGTMTFALPVIAGEESEDEEGADGEGGGEGVREVPTAGLLYEILNDSSRVEDIIAYYEQTMEDNDLRFIVAVSELHRDKDLEHFDGKARLSGVYCEFIVQDSNSEIELPPRIMAGIKRCFRGLYPKGRSVRGRKDLKYNLSVFDKAQKHVANSFALMRLSLYFEHKHAKTLLKAFAPPEKDERIEARAARAIQGVWRRKASRNRVHKKVENLASKARVNPGAMTVAERRFLAGHYSAVESRAAEALRPPGMGDEAWNMFRQSIKVLYT